MRISVISNDRLFASMLCAEIKSMGREYKISNEKAEIFIVDLDERLSLEHLAGARVIGFSRNENELSSEVIDKCEIVLHRPFLIEELKKLIEDMATQKNTLAESTSGALVFNDEEMSVRLFGERIRLSQNEYAVLSKLNENSCSPVSREKLCEVLSSSAGNMCDVYICHLRNKLESVCDKKLIFTVRGKGYMLKI